jgi:hypothetical protein
VDAQQLRRAFVALFDTARTHYGKANSGSRKGNTLARQPLPTNPLPERFGLYPIAPGDDRTRVGVLDFDNHGDAPLPWASVVNAARPILAHLRTLGHHPMPFRSTGGKGLHAWLAWEQPQPGASIRRLLTEAVEAGGMEVGDGGIVADRVEVFPKQDAVPADGWGGPIDPPLSGKSVPLDPETLDPITTFPAIVVSPPLPAPTRTRIASSERGPAVEWKEEVVRSALAAIPADDYEDWITVLRALRGGSARARVDAKPIAEEWSRTSSKHDARDFERKWERGFPKERAGRGRSLKTLYWLARERFNWQSPESTCCVARIRIQNSQPTLFLVTVIGFEDREITMYSADLNSKKGFIDRVTDVIHRIIVPPTPGELNELMANAVMIETDDSATTLGQFRGHLLAFLDEALVANKEELHLAGRAWRDEAANRTYFKWSDLEAWLRRQRHFEVKHSEAFHLVRLLSGGKGTVDLGRFGRQAAWWVPLNPREQSHEPSPAPLPAGPRTPF